MCVCFVSSICFVSKLKVSFQPHICVSLCVLCVCVCSNIAFCSKFIHWNFSQENIPKLIWLRGVRCIIQRFAHLIAQTIEPMHFHHCLCHPYCHCHCHRQHHLSLSLQCCWFHSVAAVAFGQSFECKWYAAMQYSKTSSIHWHKLSSACHLCWKSNESYEWNLKREKKLCMSECSPKESTQIDKYTQNESIYSLAKAIWYAMCVKCSPIVWTNRLHGHHFQLLVTVTLTGRWHQLNE